MKLFQYCRYMLPVCFLPVFISACGGGEENKPNTPVCGTPPATAFASATLLTTVNSAEYDAGAEITSEQLSLYLHSNRAGGYGNLDIYVSQRNNTQAPWETPVNLGASINSAFNDQAATLSSDKLTMIFASDRGGDMDLYISQRNSTSAPWGAAINLGGGINTSSTDSGPSMSHDGLTLVFFSDRAGGSGSSDLYISTRKSTGEPWSTPVNLGLAVNSSSPDVAPDISCDAKRIYFHSARNGNFDIWMTERLSLSDPWKIPTLVDIPVSTDYIETGPSISADEKSLYFASTRPGSDIRDIWRVTR